VELQTKEASYIKTYKEIALRADPVSGTNGKEPLIVSQWV